MTLVGCIEGVVIELEGDGRYVNAWADDPDLLAAPPAALIGRTVDEILGPELGAPWTERIARVHRTGVVEHTEYDLVIRGVRRRFLADVKRVGAGASATVVVFARDITARHETELALARSEERFQLAARAADDVLWESEIVAGEVQRRTTPDRQVHGATAVAWWRERVHPDDVERVLRSVDDAIASGAASWSASYRFRTSDDASSDVLDRAFIVRDASGVACRMVGSMIDVSPVKRLEAKLAQAERLAALGLLAAGVGHEINNPLTYVMGNLTLAVEALDGGGALGAADRAELLALMRDAHDGAQRVARIVQKLKATTQSGATESGPVDVGGAIESAVKMADHEIRHRARLVVELGRTPPIRATEHEVVQVFLNLAVNAAHALGAGDPERHEIRVVSGVDERGRVFVSFRDTGCGMSPETVARVFDPFFTTKPVGVGTGLGLSICHGIVKRLGGDIDVKSTVGAGTTFTVTFAPFELQKRPRARVLVVDDEAPIGRLVSRMLAAEADVVALTSAHAALSKLEAREHFDVVLCDLMMPELSGMDLYEAIRVARPEVTKNVVFMTGGAFTSRSREFLASSGARTIDKPLDAKALRSLVAQAA
jgi:signal transduction histidine kinase